MNLSERLAAQLASPHGWAGLLLGQAMDFANRCPTRLALNLLQVRPGERILDAGCGTGAALATLISRVDCDACGVDASPTMVATARARLKGRARIEQDSIENASFSSGSFDAALALNVLYFADEHGCLVSALRRLLKPGGRLVVYVTDRHTMTRWRFARVGRHRLFDTKELVNALVAGGFERAAISVFARSVAPGVRGLLALATNGEVA